MSVYQCDCDYILGKHVESPNVKTWNEHYDNCSSLLDGNARRLKNPDGTMALPNKHLLSLEVDILYHLGLDTATHDLPNMFGDVKFVCIGGTKHRMREFAEMMAKRLGHKGDLANLTKRSHRFAMYKVGPLLSVSHGIGIPSMTVVLQELLKLLQYAGANQPIIIRIGTSGGLAVPPGSVVVTEWGMNGNMEKCYDLPILGKLHKFPSFFDKRLGLELVAMATRDDDFQTIIGGTMAADDFYRGQGRLDGPFCEHSEEDKLAFLKKLSAEGVRNLEMEATALSAMVREAGLRGTGVCVTLLDRLNGDQVTTPKEVLMEWQKRPMEIVGRYIEKYVQNYLMK